MKETVKTSRTAGYLEKIFRALNAKYFNGELEEPIITIIKMTNNFRNMRSYSSRLNVEMF